MIAEKYALGKHFGWEAMLLMMKYGQTHLNCEKFIAKIGFKNVKSQKMFKKMQFDEVSRSIVFREITYERDCSTEWLEWLDSNVDFCIGIYDN